MILSEFEYFAPKTIEEACRLLSQHDRAKILAGGTDLLVEIKNEVIVPPVIIDLKKIDRLDAIDYDEVNGLRIGSLATIRSIETNQIIRDKYPLLYHGAHVLGSVQVRNRATIGGNICHAVPSGDMLPSLIALGATMRIAGLEGERKVPAEEFFTGVRTTELATGEILLGIDISPMPKKAGGVYLKHTLRRAMDLAIVGVAAFLEKKNDGKGYKNIRIALGAVAPTPIRATKAEEMLEGKNIDIELIDKAAEAASEECSPISDIRASAAYRRAMVKVLVRRAVFGILKVI